MQIQNSCFIEHPVVLIKLSYSLYANSEK